MILLPHGYEGQGPEHSSARLERFLQLSGDDNWRVMNPTKPAQLFHALRGQLHRNFRKPLVVMTPKSLLRHPLAVSQLSEFTDGRFCEVIGDPDVHPAKVQRIVMCSGKVYYDLLAARTASSEERIALVRLEQLYPLAEGALLEALDPFEAATELVWCQEEPINMGAWSDVAPHLRELVDVPVRYVGRGRSSSPATGSKHLHDTEQADLVSRAMEIS